MEQVQWCFQLPFVSHDPSMKVLTFSWSPDPGDGSLSVDPAKHGAMRRIINEQKYLSSLRIQFSNTYLHKRIEVRVIIHNGYF